MPPAQHHPPERPSPLRRPSPRGWSPQEGRARAPALLGAVGLVRAAAELLWTADCAGCARPGAPWCPRCAGTLPGAPLRRALPGGDLVVAAAAHEGPARALLLSVKEGGRAELRGVAAALLAGALLDVVPRCAEAGAAPGAVVHLVPVPSRWASRRRRGGELVADLAARSAARLRAAGLPVRVHRGLVLRRRVRDQAGLGRSERLANVRGALRWAGPPPPGICVVVDDVVTTGATAAEAVRALRAVRADVRAVAALTLAGAAAPPAVG